MMILILGLLVLGTGAGAELLCTVIPGWLKQVDAGAGKVYGVNGDDDVYQWVNGDWKLIPGEMIHVTAGPGGVWGVDRDNIVYKLELGSWVAVSGLLKQIDAGGDKYVVGTNAADNIYCLNQVETISTSTNKNYIGIPGSLKYYSSGPYGCWGVNYMNNIYYRTGVLPNSCQGTQWQQVEGSLVMVEVGTDGSVYGVNSEGHVYTRNGISASNPIGTSWTQLDFCGTFKHVSYDRGSLWLITQNGGIYKCRTNTAIPSNCDVMP